MKVLARSSALLAGFAVALLALLGAGGLWVRPAADDWCYQTNMRTMSVRQFVHFLYQDSNGRAGNAVLLAWVHGLGPLGLKVYPVVVIALLLGSLWLLVARLTRLAGRHVPAAVQLLTAATAALVFLLVCPQPYQTTYWASGGISHTVPAVLATVLVSAVLCLPGRSGRAGLAGRWTAALALLLGFAFIALVSEAMALVVGVLAAVLWLRAGDVCADRPARRAARLGALAAIAGSAGGLLVEYLSPGMHARSAGLGVPHGTVLLHRLREGMVTWLGDVATTVTSFDYVAVVLAGVLLGLTTRHLAPDALTRAAFAWPRSTARGPEQAAAPSTTAAGPAGLLAGPGTTATVEDEGPSAPGPVAGAAGPATPAFAVPSPLLVLPWAAAGVMVGSLLVTLLVQAVFGTWIWYMLRTWNDWPLPYVLLLAAVAVAAGRLLATALRTAPGTPSTTRPRRAA
ncbi:hypothetical protein DN069_18040, partial [Streptacidiphilus pinicola]